MRAQGAWLALVLLIPATTAGQGPPIQRWQGEARLEVIAGRTTEWHVSAGANAALGLYTRLALLTGVGVRHLTGAWRRSAHVDALARFQLDPLLQFKYGAYVGGGGTLLADDGAPARVRTLVVLGVEGAPTRGRWIAGFELGLGGGARLGVTLRRARKQAR